ncbi:MAG: PDZ domain-containing protein [Polyangiales bacterium]|nr:PDZ domain-containing protein [Myxococcales bacterium]
MKGVNLADMRARSLLILALGCSMLLGCAYPRRSTSLGAVGRSVGSADAPPDVWQLKIRSARLPAQRPGSLAWDEDGSGPDPYVRIYRGKNLVFESSVKSDTTEPSWNETLPKNIWLPRTEELRVEVWDRDGLNSDPVGVWRGTGLPATALEDADVRLSLSNDTVLEFRVERPVPHQGVGIRLYEAQNDSLVVLEVIRHSPAGRAGIEPGDRIVEIGGRPVEELGPGGAASALSMAAQDHSALVVIRDDGQQRNVQLDDGYVWLLM